MLFDYLTVGESLQFSGMLRGLSRERVQHESHSLLVSLGLEDKIDAMRALWRHEEETLSRSRLSWRLKGVI